MEYYIQKLGLNINFPFVLIVAALIWTRILSVIVVIPFLFGRPVPRTARLGSSIVITIFLYPILVTGTSLPPDIDFMRLFALFLKEVLFGLSLGFSASLMFYGFQAAGQMIDNQRGVSLARILIPALGEQASITASFLFQFSVVVFLVIGGHRIFLHGLVQSYQVLPILEFPETVIGLLPIMDLFMVMTGKVLYISMQIAAPVIIAILMTDIILGVANRFAPQINVWELGFNIRGYVGILMLFLSITFIARQIEHYTAETNRNNLMIMEMLKRKPPPGSEPIEAPEVPLEIPHPIVPSP